MKRVILGLLLTLGVLACGWSIAQPPVPGVDEPPVRLKKKKKNDRPESSEPGKEKTEPQPEARPQRPKLDEDAELDPRDGRAGRTEEADDSAIVKRLARNTRQAEERLANRELGGKTKELHQDILSDLDRLIQKARQSQQNPQQPQPQDDSGQKDPPQSSSKEDPTQKRLTRQRERQNRRGEQTAQRPQSQQGQQGQGNNPDNPKGGGDSRAQGAPKDPDRKFDLWGHLPEKERALMNKEMEQKFMDKYDDLTKQYYRTIAEKSLKKN